MQYDIENEPLQQPFLLAELTVAYHPSPTLAKRMQVRSSGDAYRIFKRCYPEGMIGYKEFCYAMYLNNQNMVLGVHLYSIGGMAATIVDVRQIFALALKVNAARLVVCHNHPSGAHQPSKPDRKLTTKLTRAGAILDVPLLDHLILTTESYFSFADEGLISDYSPLGE